MAQQGDRLTGSAGSAGWECASHEIQAAPGAIIFVHGWLDGRRQTIAVDPSEVDELTRRLHQAKRLARREVPMSSGRDDAVLAARMMVTRGAVASVALSHPKDCRCDACKAARGDVGALVRIMQAENDAR